MVLYVLSIAAVFYFDLNWRRSSTIPVCHLISQTRVQPFLCLPGFPSMLLPTPPSIPFTSKIQNLTLNMRIPIRVGLYLHTKISNFQFVVPLKEYQEHLKVIIVFISIYFRSVWGRDGKSPQRLQRDGQGLLLSLEHSSFLTRVGSCTSNFMGS